MTETPTPSLKQKIYGPIIEDKCDACGQNSVWLLAKTSRTKKIFGRFSLTQSEDYTLVCMLCGYKIALHKSLFLKLKPLAAENSTKMTPQTKRPPNV